MSTEIYWFPFEWNRWLSNEKLSMASLEARGLWMHLICLMYKSNCEGLLLIDGIKPSVPQISRMVGSTEEKVAPILKELEQLRILEIDKTTGAYFHLSVKNGLVKMNQRKDAYSQRFKKKHVDRLLIDTPSMPDTCTHNNSNNNNNIVKSRPTRTEWVAYSKEIGWPISDAETAFDYYESNGWKVGGRTAVKDWKACARYCFRRGNQNKKGQQITMKPKPQTKSSCDSPPLYRVMGYASYSDWQNAGCPS
jgi:hypothetical protein